MWYIQLPYGYVKNNKQIQFHLPKGYEEENIIKMFLILQIKILL